MRLARFILSSGALFAAAGILFTSLSAGNSRLVAQAHMFEASQKQFYLSQKILPDHVAYPVLMAFDRAKLETSSPSQHIYLQVEYAQRRFTYAQELLSRQHTNLALTTLTKAQKYLLQAAQEAQQPDVTPEVKAFVLKNLTYYDQEIEALKPQFTSDDQSVVGHHEQELQFLQDQLSGQLSASL